MPPESTKASNRGMFVRVGEQGLSVVSLDEVGEQGFGYSTFEKPAGIAELPLGTSTMVLTKRAL